MGRRSDHKRDELREMALTAAEEIVAEEGELGLTTRKVAARIGYSVGTLYVIFQNLDDLKLAVNARHLAGLGRQLGEVRSAVKEPADRLRKMAHIYLDFALAEPNLWRLMFEHQLPGAEEMPDSITRQTDTLLVLLLDSFAEMLPDAGSERVHAVASAYWSALHGVTHLVVTNKLQLAHVESAHEVLDCQLDMLFSGLS